MKPVHARTEKAFREGLQCVQYRIPRLYSLKPVAFAHALGLRYGLIGLAACHHLLISADLNEEETLESDFLGWQDEVAEHIRYEVVRQLPFETLVAFPSVVGRFAIEPIYCYMTQRTRLLPFDYYLEIALSEYEAEHRAFAAKEWPIWHRRRARTEWHAANRESLKFAQNFLERRESGEEEVPEIALLGE